MATGRTTDQWKRFYADGYDLSGYARSLGDLRWEYDAPTDAAWTDRVKNLVALGRCVHGIGALNAFFDNTADVGVQVLETAGTMRTVMIPQGIRVAPAAGDPVYIGQFEQTGYRAANDNSMIVVNAPFENRSASATALAYTKPWGVLLHAKAARTAVNTAVGIDDNGASSVLGGYLCYQLFSSDGTVTIKVQDAATNLDGSFADLSGATSGVVDASTTPAAGIVALGTTATVRRYLRWQIALGTANTCTFALAFVRGQ